MPTVEAVLMCQLYLGHIVWSWQVVRVTSSLIIILPCKRESWARVHIHCPCLKAVKHLFKDPTSLSLRLGDDTCVTKTDCRECHRPKPPCLATSKVPPGIPMEQYCRRLLSLKKKTVKRANTDPPFGTPHTWNQRTCLNMSTQKHLTCMNNNSMQFIFV